MNWATYTKNTNTTFLTTDFVAAMVNYQTIGKTDVRQMIVVMDYATGAVKMLLPVVG